MPSSGDQERHEADTGGAPDAGDCMSRPFDEILVKYEQFADKVATTRRSEVIWSSTSGRVEARRDQGEPAKVSTSVNQDENKGVVPEVEEVDDPSLVVPEELQTQAEDFSFPSSVIKREDLVGLMHTFHLPIGHRVLIPRVSDGPSYPPPGYMVISSYHLIIGLRFPLP
ncbi:hypothetical protein ACOSQ2_031540 [Xanthoceras sorbifolium]